MAISKILHMNSHIKSKGFHLKVGIDYILDKNKTEGGHFIGSVNCNVERTYENMLATKEIYGKNNKRQGYHLIISFEKDETDGETAFAIANEFVTTYLSSDYQAVYSVHTNTDHIHIHIIWNSVRFTDGYKYRYELGDWERDIQPLVNSICEKHGLKTLDPTIRADEKEKEWDVSKNGPFVWNEQIRMDVDAAIIEATDFDMFIQLLEEKDYQIKRGKYLSVKPKGMERFRRLKTLGDEYLENKIRERIENESITKLRETGIVSSPFAKANIHKKKNLTGLQKQYYAILYKLGMIKQHSYSQSYKYKNEIKKFNRLQKQYLFLTENNIASKDDVEKLKSETTKNLAWHNKAKKVLQNENQKYTEVFEALDVINKEKRAEMLFVRGDDSFKDEDLLVKKAKTILKENNLEYADAQNVHKHYKEMLENCNKEIKKCRSDLFIIRGILKEIEYINKQEQIEKTKELEEKKINRDRKDR